MKALFCRLSVCSDSRCEKKGRLGMSENALLDKSKIVRLTSGRKRSVSIEERKFDDRFSVCSCVRETKVETLRVMSALLDMFKFVR